MNIIMMKCENEIWYSEEEEEWDDDNAHSLLQASYFVVWFLLEKPV